MDTPPSLDYYSADEAALQLGLRLTSSSRNSARFEDSLNTVVVFLSAPKAEVYLNGHRYLADGVMAENDHLVLTEGLISEIRRELRAGPSVPSRTYVVAPAARPTKPAAAQPTAPQSLVRGVVVLDAGHGGKDPGAPNRYGPPEKVIALDITQRVRDLLVARGVRVVMTRDGDTYPDLDDRVAIANHTHPDLFVAIHVNSARNTAIRGYTVIVPEVPSAAAMSAGAAVHHALSNVTVSRGLVKDVRGLRVLQKTTCPAMLVETGFFTNAYEARQLDDASYRQQLANAIAEGIAQYLQRR